ncbi:MAG: hypothetical protein KKH22_11825, partial [Proteobacteria bacterium]|nr:hypothetical protein [Pseudomonadota bacterium]
MAVTSYVQWIVPPATGYKQHLVFSAVIPAKARGKREERYSDPLFFLDPGFRRDDMYSVKPFGLSLSKSNNLLKARFDRLTVNGTDFTNDF